MSRRRGPTTSASGHDDEGPSGDDRLRARATDTQQVVREFHRLFYRNSVRTWQSTRWLGMRMLKCPLDLWIYQEILFERRPDLIIETGTAWGASALFMAGICEMMGCGRVLTIDLEPKPGRPEHPRIAYLHGSSTAPDILAQVEALVKPGEKVMAVLDSLHECEHVLAELRTYGALVTPGQYLIVEDTNINGHPIRRNFGPGPMEAVEAFLAETDAFYVDDSQEKFFLTFNPRGYLRRRD